jgi:peptidoglycan/xylan/chitin deacetylase (PgdA/CDA1 family)
MYHSIGLSPTKHPASCVSERNFEHHVRYLTRHYEVVSLEEIATRMMQGESLPKNGVAITFDDGYRDNYELAFPILKRHGCTATIFVATGPLETGTPLWQHKLYCWLATTTATTLALELEGREGLFHLRTRSQRRGAYWTINLHLRKADSATREARLQKIARKLGFAPNGDSSGIVPVLTWSELREMSAECFDVGAHTVTHPVLTSLSSDEAMREVRDSKMAIERALNRPVTLFAYPFGELEHFNEETKRLVEKSGYGAACSAINGLVLPETDRFALPRLYVPDVPVAVFAHMLLTVLP